LKRLEENIGKTLEGTESCNEFLRRTPVAQEIRARIDKHDCFLKLLPSKRNNYQNKHNLQNARKSLLSIHQIKDQYTEYK
jgi:hypothetical protein